MPWEKRIAANGKPAQRGSSVIYLPGLSRSRVAMLDGQQWHAGRIYCLWAWAIDRAVFKGGDGAISGGQGIGTRWGGVTAIKTDHRSSRMASGHNKQRAT